MEAGTAAGVLPESDEGVSILTGGVTRVGEGEGVGCLAEASVGGSWTGKLAAMDIYNEQSVRR